MKERRELKQIEQKQAQQEQFKQSKAQQKQEFLNSILPNPIEAEQENALYEMIDKGVDIDVVEDLLVPKENITELEAKRRNLDLGYAEQKFAENLERGRVEARKYIQKTLADYERRQGFKNIVFKEEEARGLVPAIQKANTPAGVGSYNIDLIKKGGSK